MTVHPLWAELVYHDSTILWPFQLVLLNPSLHLSHPAALTSFRLVLGIDCLYSWVQHDVQIFSGESVLVCTFNYILTNVLSSVRAVGEPFFFSS